MTDSSASSGAGESPTKLAARLRFHIGEMSERNAHHDFEHMCFEIARRRIATNLVPATGPVSGGGDQGRDFESFVSYIPPDTAPDAAITSPFTALVSDEQLSFTCTLQKDSLSTKIRDDVRKIVSSGGRVDRVYAFLGEALSVANRHSVQQSVRAEFSIELDIFDRHAIAIMLADHDLYWIAVEYLQAPIDAAPRQPISNTELPQWYALQRDEWTGRLEQGEPAISMADLVQLRENLDASLFSEDARGDLDYWTECIAPLASSPVYIVQQLARYSIAVAKFRGGSEADGDAAARSFFGDLGTTEDPGLLHDASTLLVYTCTASTLRWSALTRSDCESFRATVAQRVGELLSEEIGPNRRTALLEVLSDLYLIPDMHAIHDAMGDEAVEVERRTAAFPTRHLGREDLTADLSDLPFVDVDRGMSTLRQLVDLLPEAPLFPVDRLADHFDLFSTAAVDHPEYSAVRDGLDEAVRKRSGAAAVAAKHRDRGMRFMQSERYLDALREMHNAKLNWWSGDTIEGAILSLLVISRAYFSLRMAWASKLYALAASITAGHASSPGLVKYVPRGLMQASLCDALTGSWLSAVTTLQEGIPFQIQFESDPWSPDHEFFRSAIQLHAAWLALLDSSSAPALSVFRELYTEAGCLNVLETVNSNRETPTVEALAEEVNQNVAQFSASYPADVGQTRSFNWSAMGIKWSVKCDNAEASSVTAERFCALFQIVLVEINDVDIVPLVQRVDIRIMVAGSPGDVEPDNQDLEQSESGEWLCWLSEYSPTNGVSVEDESIVESLGVLLAILARVSTLKANDFATVIDERVTGELLSKLLAGRPYEELIGYIPPEHWELTRSVPPESLPVFDATEEGNPELPGSNGLGPGYSSEKAQELLRSRYDRIYERIPRTLDRVVASPEASRVLRGLRAEGWLDWHIMLVLMNLSQNYRFGEQIDRLIDDERGIAAAKALMLEPESETSPTLPLSYISRQNMREYLQIGAGATLELWGLSVNMRIFPSRAVLELLANRYRFWNDDAPHRELDL